MDAGQVGNGVSGFSKSRLSEEVEDNFLRRGMPQSLEHPDRFPNDRVAWPLVAHALLRIAGSTSGILIGLYLATLSRGGIPLTAGLVGTLSAVSFAAELVASIPMGVASDALSARRLMTVGAIGGGIATILFAVSRSPSIFFVSRLLEGVSAAAIVPALLAFLTDATEGDSARRARIMSFFELTLLVGLALGGVVAAQLFRTLHAGAFAVVSVLYLVCGAILYRSVRGGALGHLQNPLDDLRQVLCLPSIRQLAPVWLCVNAVVGLWLGSTLPFLLTQRSHPSQFLSGIYASDPSKVGWALLGYAIVFGLGVAVWSFILPRMRLELAMRISIGAMLPACGSFYLINHSGGEPVAFRWSIGVVIAMLVMVESGFTPAALAWLAGTLPVESGRGAAMGIYSVLLSIGAILGSLLAGFLGQRYAIDGLLHGTVLVAVIALLFLHWVPGSEPRVAKSEHGT